MAIGLLLASLAWLAGLGVTRAARAHWSLAPPCGLAAMAVTTSWAARLGAPPLVGTGLIVALAAIGAVLGLKDVWRSGLRLKSGDRVTLGVLCGAVLAATLLIGTALAGVDAPVSTHDGAYHVELIDSLRRGASIEGWYPMGFHATVAAVLGLLPWVDAARGTIDAAQALVILGPFGVFALGLSLGLRPRLASLGALVLALTYIYPYDNQMWAGWPLGMSLLLLMGLWAVASHWVTNPTPRLAVLAGLLAGAIVLTHGTEVYSSVIGLTVIALVRWRHLQPKKVLQQAPLALVGAAACALPYVSTLVGWAAAGGASGAGADALDAASAQGQVTDNGGNWIEFILGVTGAAGLIDLPIRGILLFIGARQLRTRVPLGAWAVFGALLFAVSFLDLEPVRRLYIVTYPWLVHHRPPQLVVMFTSLLVGAGLLSAFSWFWSLRPRLAGHAGAWRRLALVSGAVLLFFAEGSAVSIYKTLQQVIVEQNVYSADDRAAMGWLQQHATPGEMVINDAAADAGIWAPYKAGLPVLLPRSDSGSGASSEVRNAIAEDLTSLNAVPTVAAQACALRAEYVFSGSKRVDGDPVAIPDRTVLEQAPGLQEVFTSGDAAVFRVDLPCAS